MFVSYPNPLILASQGGLVYVLDLFCNSPNPNVREKSAELFAKIQSDKLMGPRVRIILCKFLPAIFMDAMRDSAEASIHMFEGKCKVFKFFIVFLLCGTHCPLISIVFHLYRYSKQQYNRFLLDSTNTTQVFNCLYICYSLSPFPLCTYSVSVPWPNLFLCVCLHPSPTPPPPLSPQSKPNVYKTFFITVCMYILHYGNKCWFALNRMFPS